MADLREKIKNYVDHADERILKIFNAIIETEEEDGLSEFHKTVLDQRLQYHKDHPNEGEDWEVVKMELKKKYGV